jgi:hypothetical protein
MELIALEQLRNGSAWLVQATFSDLTVNCTDSRFQFSNCRIKWSPLVDKLELQHRNFIHDSMGHVSILPTSHPVDSDVDAFEIHLLRVLDVGVLSYGQTVRRVKNTRTISQPSGTCLFRTEYHHADALTHVPADHSLRGEWQVEKKTVTSCGVKNVAPIVHSFVRQGISLVPRSRKEMEGVRRLPPGHFSAISISFSSSRQVGEDTRLRGGVRPRFHSRKLMSTRRVRVGHGHASGDRHHGKHRHHKHSHPRLASRQMQPDSRFMATHGSVSGSSADTPIPVMVNRLVSRLSQACVPAYPRPSLF